MTYGATTTTNSSLSLSLRGRCLPVFFCFNLLFFWCVPLASPSIAGNTYNADFDGDEINLHFPQSQLVGCPCVLVARVVRVVVHVVVYTLLSCDDKLFGITVLGALTPMRTIIYGWHQN